VQLTGCVESSRVVPVGERDNSVRVVNVIHVLHGILRVILKITGSVKWITGKCELS